MAEYDRDRMDEGRDAVQERNIVRDGGIARSEADVSDVTRDTYSTPIGAPADEDRDSADEDRTRAREVLGIGTDVRPDRRRTPAASDEGRRRRADDLNERSAPQDSGGISYEGPDGLKVRD